MNIQTKKSKFKPKWSEIQSNALDQEIKKHKTQSDEKNQFFTIQKRKIISLLNIQTSDSPSSHINKKPKSSGGNLPLSKGMTFHCCTHPRRLLWFESTALGANRGEATLATGRLAAAVSVTVCHDKDEIERLEFSFLFMFSLIVSLLLPRLKRSRASPGWALLCHCYKSLWNEELGI